VTLNTTFESNQSGIETQATEEKPKRRRGLNRTKVELKREAVAFDAELKQKFESNQSGIETRVGCECVGAAE